MYTSKPAYKLTDTETPQFPKGSLFVRQMFLESRSTYKEQRKIKLLKKKPSEMISFSIYVFYRGLNARQFLLFDSCPFEKKIHCQNIWQWDLICRSFISVVFYNLVTNKECLSSIYDKRIMLRNASRYFLLLRYDQQKLNSQIYANGHLQLQRTPRSQVPATQFNIHFLSFLKERLPI